MLAHCAVQLLSLPYSVRLVHPRPGAVGNLPTLLGLPGFLSVVPLAQLA